MQSGFVLSRLAARRGEFVQRLSVIRQPVFATARAERSFVDFAPVLIAAKPLKPCDGAVFGALDLLLKMKQNATGAGQARGVAERVGALRPDVACRFRDWPLTGFRSHSHRAIPR